MTPKAIVVAIVASASVALGAQSVDLEPAKAPTDVLVIDHVERPTPN